MDRKKDIMNANMSLEDAKRKSLEEIRNCLTNLGSMNFTQDETYHVFNTMKRIMNDYINNTEGYKDDRFPWYSTMQGLRQSLNDALTALEENPLDVKLIGHSSPVCPVGTPHITPMMTSRGKPCAHTFVITQDGRQTLQSYDSIVCTVDHQRQVITFGANWDYSVTTAKYLNQFLSGLFGVDINTQDCKRMISYGMAYSNNGYADYLVVLDNNLK